MEADAIVARTEIPGDALQVNLSGALGAAPADVERYLLKRIGESFEEGELIAETKGIFGYFKSRCAAPAAGSLENVSAVTGQAIFRGPPKPLEAQAYVKGRIVETIEGEGAVVETEAAFIQGILGVGGETRGALAVAAERGGELTADSVDESHRGKTLIVGGAVRADAVQRAAEIGAAGIMAGCMDAEDLRECLGYELGVAVTGTEQIGLTVILTEGFGRIDMAEKTFALLRSLEGREASINGATQIRAGVARPEMIVPLESGGESPPLPPPLIMEVGAPVRVIREPHFGEIGVIEALPVEPQEIETEARVRAAVVRLESGGEILLPRANIELMGS